MREKEKMENSQMSSGSVNVYILHGDIQQAHENINLVLKKKIWASDSFRSHTNTGKSLKLLEYPRRFR